MTSEFFGRQRECGFYMAGCGNKMAVTVTGPRAVNELGGPVIPGKATHISGRFLAAITQPNRLYSKRIYRVTCSISRIDASYDKGRNSNPWNNSQNRDKRPRCFCSYTQTSSR